MPNPQKKQHQPAAWEEGTAVEAETLDDMQELLVEVFSEVCHKREDKIKGNNDNALYKTIRDYIQNHFHDTNLNQQQIAADLNLSSTHVSKIFRSHESASITNYITELRLNQAKQLLEADALTVNEVLQAVGFWNQSYFFKLFKKKFGTTPQEYRNMKKDNDSPSK